MVRDRGAKGVVIGALGPNVGVYRIHPLPPLHPLVSSSTFPSTNTLSHCNIFHSLFLPTHHLHRPNRLPFPTPYLLFPYPSFLLLLNHCLVPLPSFAPSLPLPYHTAITSLPPLLSLLLHLIPLISLPHLSISFIYPIMLSHPYLTPLSLLVSTLLPTPTHTPSPPNHPHFLSLILLLQPSSLTFPFQ